MSWAWDAPRPCAHAMAYWSGVDDDDETTDNDTLERPTEAWEGVPTGVLTDLADDAGFNPADCC